jgi:hypothetical protein
MNTNDTRAAARSRATRRLRTITIGTALVGLAATGGLGWVAAGTFSGSATRADLTAAVVSTTVADDGTGSTTTGTAPSVSAALGRAHTTTGGS